MPNSNLSTWRSKIASGDNSKRVSAWLEVCSVAPELDPDELAELIRLLERDPGSTNIKEDDFRINSLVQMLAAQPWRGDLRTDLKEWFFGPFRPRLGGNHVSNPCACIGVCDREHLRDVQAQLILARHLASNRFPDTHFYHVPFHHPDWSDVGIDKINALCVIGRPSMFIQCPVLEDLAKLRPQMRFALPKDDETWRSKPLSHISAEHFHHISQTPSLLNTGASLFYASDEDCSPDGNRRTDYALVQRFSILSNRRKITVIILAGTTSLGTVGAAEWVTNGECEEELKKACDRFRMVLKEDTEMEVLLRITAEVRNPARPWKPLGRVPIKLFLDDSANAIAESISRVTVVTRNGVPVQVFFDDDEVRFRKSQGFADIAAICKSACRFPPEKRSAIPLECLAKDKELATALRLKGEEDIAGLTIRINDHLKDSKRLGNVVMIDRNLLKFSCVLRHIEDSGPPAS